MMTGYKIVNLKLLIEEIGEERTKNEFLSNFSCPYNKDVEEFLKHKAIEFSKQGLSQTHLVFASYKGKPALAGYFTLANKYIHIQAKNIPSSTWRKRISKFGTFDHNLKSYVLSAPLIGQLGKNYTNGYHALITGDELLKMACDKIISVQLVLGGKCMYLECEDTPKLVDFYETNGFCCFGKRELEKDERDKHSGEYLLQYLRYIKDK